LDVNHKLIKAAIFSFANALNKLRANRLHCRQKHSSGFTLLELLIVIAIIATLSAISIPAYYSYLEKSRLTTVTSDIRLIDEQLLFFEMNNGRLPETLAEAGINLVDQWGNPYQYTLLRGKPLTGPGKVTPRKDKSLHPLNSDYDLYSMGPDGKTNAALTAEASQDDIIRAGDGNYVGIAANY
jgi:general secretion pathway protein G